MAEEDVKVSVSAEMMVETAKEVETKESDDQKNQETADDETVANQEDNFKAVPEEDSLTIDEAANADNEQSPVEKSQDTSASEQQNENGTLENVTENEGPPEDSDVVEPIKESQDKDEVPIATETTEQETEEEMNEPVNYNYDEIPQEDGTGPDIKIANREFEEEEGLQYDQGVDTFENQEFPDAYATPPPTDMDKIYEYDAFGNIPEEDESDRESSLEYPVFDRAQLLEKYREIIEERSQLQNLNNQLQHKLAEYFRKKKTDERVQEIEKNVTDQEQRYLKYISNLQELQSEERRQEEEIKAQKEEMEQRCLEKQEKVEEASKEFMKFKYEVAKAAINSRSGKAIPQKNLDIFQASEQKKEQEVRQVRLENIKLKNKLRKKEQQLKAKEELAEGLHLIDFEQLKIENQTYNEKIEERNEEILKLRKKITTTVQVLTHLKEKLQFVQGENGEQRTKLRNIEATVAQKRDILTRTKQVRDALRMDNLKLKQKSGLLGNESLLRDFELRKDEADDLGQKLTDLKTGHTDLSMNLNGVKKKIRQSRDKSP